MKATGVVRRIDDLGRVVIPKEIRKVHRIKEGDPLEIFTDSDGAGFRIRNYLKNILKDCKVRHAYIPDIVGKEKRKNHHSKEGFLGVEGVSDEIILKSLENAGNL